MNANVEHKSITLYHADFPSLSRLSAAAQALDNSWIPNSYINSKYRLLLNEAHPSELQCIFSSELDRGKKV